MSIKGPQLPLSPLLFGALLGLYSCGSSPSADEAPPIELVVEAVPEVAPQVDPEPALDRQLAEMQAAIDGVRGEEPGSTLAAEDPDMALAVEVPDDGTEPLDGEPMPEEALVEVPPPTEAEQVATEVEGLFLDPGEVFPVEIMDGVPGQIAMQVDEPEIVPEAELDAEPFTLVVEESDLVAAEDSPAEEVELEQQIGMEGFTAEDMAAMAEAFGDPGLVFPEEPIEEELVLAEPEFVESDELAELGAAAESPGVEELVAYPMPDELLEDSELAEVLEPMPEPMEGAELLATDFDEGLGAESDPALELAVAPDELIELIDFNEFGNFDQPNEFEEADALAEGPGTSEDPELTDTELAEARTELDEPMDAATLVWQIVVPEPVHIDLMTNEGASPSVDEELRGIADPVTGLGDELAEGPEALEIETVVETPVATALEPAAPSALVELMAFTESLDPTQRMLLGPLVLVDPSGGLARFSLGLQGLADSTALMTAGPPEDPSLVGLSRSNGSEFDPTPIEPGQLTGDPGLGMIWWSGDVPMAQVDSEVEVQTPSVGRVRVVLNSGDYVEGILHSVGMGQYWIDGDLGRFAVRAGLVAHIEHLPKPGLGVETKGLQAGDLVRAKAKTGFIEGRLVSMKDGKALIETATGMRITIPDAEVEPLGASKTRVVID